MRFINFRHTIVLVLFFLVPLVAASQPSDLKLQVVQSEFTFTQDTIKMASILRNDNGSYRGLRIQLKPGAARQLIQITKANVGKNINLIINNKILHTTLLTTELDNDLLFTDITQDAAQGIINHLNQKRTLNVSPIFSSIND